MRKRICTDNGVIEYDEREFVLGEKRINRRISADNLLEFKEVMDSRGVAFGLIYGTLLGAIREGDFIEHDEDTDVSVLDEYKNDFLNCLSSLLERGFEVGRYDGELLSIIKDGEYLDIYFFKKSLLGNRVFSQYVVGAKYLEKTVKFNFLGAEFQIPCDAEKLLEDLYGKDWRIPKEGAPASNYGLYLTFTTFVQKRFPVAFRAICQLKRAVGLSKADAS